MKHIYRFLILAILFPCASWALDGIDVTGTVVTTIDPKNKQLLEPLEFADVFYQGTSTHTKTNKDGKFSLPYLANKTLVISLTGHNQYTYNTQSTIPTEDMDLGTIILTPSESIEEVITVAINCHAQDHLNALDATEAKEKSDHSDCYPTKCKDTFELSGDGEDAMCISKNGSSCVPEIKFATNATYDCDDTKCVCKVQNCQSGYKPNSDNTNCTSIDKDCTEAQKKEIEHGLEFEHRGTEEKCYVTKCECGYILDISKNTCEKDNEKITIGQQCNPMSTGATAATMQCQSDLKKAPVCTITACDPNTYLPEPQNNKCISKENACTGAYPLPEFAKSGHREYKNGKDVCIVDKCKDTFELSGDGEDAMCISKNGSSCVPEIKFATNATYDCDNTKCVCKVQNCQSGYKPNSDSTQCVSIDKDCTDEQKKQIPNGLEFEHRGTEENCYVTKCECGYILDISKNECEKDDNKITIGQQCNPMPAGATTATMQCQSDLTKAPVCTITACDPNTYLPEPQKNKCISKEKACTGTYPLPEFAKSGHREYKNGEDVCIVDECKKGYIKINDDMACTPERTYSPEEIAEKEKALQNAKDKENSLLARLTGGASIGATGVGGMMLAQSLAEQTADNNADTDMAGYMATFHCDYGSGQRANGGDTDIVLSGGNQLIGIKDEYIKLATELKSTKEQLGLKPGIESEIILNNANIGLYDDESTGGINKIFNADKTAAEREKTSTNLKIGAGVAAVGIAVGVAGNIINERNFKDTDTKTSESDTKTDIKNLTNTLNTGKTNIEKLDLCKRKGGTWTTNNICICQDGYKWDSNLGCVPNGSKTSAFLSSQTPPATVTAASIGTQTTAQLAANNSNTSQQTSGVTMSSISTSDEQEQTNDDDKIKEEAPTFQTPQEIFHYICETNNADQPPVTGTTCKFSNSKNAYKTAKAELSKADIKFTHDDETQTITLDSGETNATTTTNSAQQSSLPDKWKTDELPENTRAYLERFYEFCESNDATEYQSGSYIEPGTYEFDCVFDPKIPDSKLKEHITTLKHKLQDINTAYITNRTCTESFSQSYCLYINYGATGTLDSPEKSFLMIAFIPKSSN